MCFAKFQLNVFGEDMKSIIRRTGGDPSRRLGKDSDKSTGGRQQVPSEGPAY